MFTSVADRLRKIAFMVGDNYSGDSPYLNIPIYQQRTDWSDHSQELQMGPPSMYDDTDTAPEKKDTDRMQVKEDIRRQGPRPQPRDPFEKNILPVIVTNIGGPRENEQGEDTNDTTTPEGRNEDKDTIGFDPGEVNVDPFRK